METLDTASGAIDLLAPPGLVAPGSGDVVSASIKERRTTLTTTTLEGRSKLSTDLHGRLVADVVSGSGRLIALTPPRDEGATPWMPDGRRRTEIVIASLDGGEPSRFRLKGNFQPEAFSTDDRTLFLIEYMPAMAPSHYSVKRLNLGSGRVAPIARLKLAAPGVMRGTGRMQILSPDGSQLYTLYTKQGVNYAHGTPEDHRPGRVHAFVHVLDLDEGWAHCVDLPMPFGSGDATASAMALSPSGHRLYVTDPTNGAVATIDPEKLRVVSNDEIPAAKPDDRTYAAIGANGPLYIASGSTVTLLDPFTWKTIGSWRAASEIVGLASHDEMVYAATRSGVTHLSNIGVALRAWTVKGLGSLAGVFSKGS